MADDIFGNVQPPAWLQRLTQPSEPGMLGKVFGQLVGGLGESAQIAFQKAKTKQEAGEDISWLKELPSSIQPGFFQARMNIERPMWQLEVQQAQLNMAKEKVVLDAAQHKLNMDKAEMAQWDIDAPKLSKWLSLPYQEQINTPIDVLSTSALKMVEQQKGKAVRLAYDSVATKMRTGFANGLLRVEDPQVLSEISAMQSNPDGTPSAQQIGRLNQYFQSKGKPLVGETRQPLETAAVRNVKAVQDLQAQMDDAIAAGDEETYQRLSEERDMLLEQMKSMEVQTTVSPTGEVTTTYGRGAGKAPVKPSEPTPGARTRAQEDLVKYQNNDQLIDQLAEKLKPEHVGVKGFLGELLVDKGLAQFLPVGTTANPERIAGRSMISTLLEGMMRQISQDPTRFTAADREEIAKIFPTTHPLESYDDAMTRLATVKEIYAKRAVNDAHFLEKPAPEWALRSIKFNNVLKLFREKNLTQDEVFTALEGRIDPNKAAPINLPWFERY